MKKKIIIFISALALLVCSALPVFADEARYGRYAEAGDSETLKTVVQLSQGIYDNYGIDAFYVINDEESGKGSAKEYAENLVDHLTFENDVILYAKTADDTYIYTRGICENVEEDELNTIETAVSEYDGEGMEDMAAITFLANVNAYYAQDAAGGSFEADGEGDGGEGEDVASLPALISPAPDSTETIGITRVLDKADLLTDDEESKLNERLGEIRDEQQFDVVVATTNDFEGKSVEAYADDLFDYSGYGIGENRDGCILVVNPDTRDWYISTRGYGITAMTDAGIQYIGDEIKGDFADGDWNGGFVRFAELADKFVAQAKKGKPYDVGNLPKQKKSILKGLLISLVIALVVAFIIMKKIKGDYEKAVRFSADAKNYLVNGSLQVVGSYDNFMYQNVNRVAIQKESSGGSSTHTSSSGASHGGGGGKF